MRMLWSALKHGLAANVRFAVGAILEYKLRSSLTILGIVVGVTTVMAMVAIVTGFNKNVIGNLQAFGSNRIEFQRYDDRFGPGGPRGDEERRRKNLTVEDAEALREALPEATVASLVALYRTNELPFHLKKALDNGLSREELIEAIMHLAFYSGWPTASSALQIAQRVFEEAGV